MKHFLFSILAWLMIGTAFAADPLPPEQAFPVIAEALDDKRVSVRFAIEPGYYLYRDKLRFSVEAPAELVGEALVPPGDAHTDAFFGTQAIFRFHVEIILPVKAPLNTPFNLTLTYQGCADVGVCYPPIHSVFPITMTGVSRAPGAAGLAAQFAGPGDVISAIAVPPSEPEPGLNEDESADVLGLLQGQSLGLLLLSFFGFGLLLSFTPCVLPMVPILSAIIVGHGADISRRRAFALSLAYVIGMALAYAAAGVLAGVSGTFLAAVLQNAWVLGSFSAIFVVLALGMFGVYSLQMPAALQVRLGALAQRQGGSLWGLGVMGALSALIVGPCVAAPLAGALLYIAQTGDAVLGASALFVMALGMGLPLIVVAVAARHWLPKAGPWMTAVKRFFGVLLLATALWLVGPLLAPMWLVLAWAALALMCGLYVWIQARGLAARGLSLVLLGIAAILALGAFNGARDPLEAWPAVRGDLQVAEAPHFMRIGSLAELDAELATADKPVILDFYADWCVSCKEMERFTFADPAVAQRLAGFSLLQVDVTQNTEDEQMFLRRFGLFGPPAIIFFNHDGQEMEGVRVVGYMPAKRFGPLLDKVRANLQ